MAVHAGAHHDPHLEHHFDTPQQQFSSCKLGMWLFLATEILLFGGLFCAYAIYRAMHPEIFMWGHVYLDTTWGAINTVVLIASSFTMAWGVRCAQLGKQKGLLVCLALTFLGGVLFMGIKGFEYKAKFEKSMYPGKYFAYASEGHVEDEDHDATPLAHPAAAEVTLAGVTIEKSDVPLAPAGNPGLAEVHKEGPYAYHGPTPEKARVFFSIYYGMTGLHAIHVILGMGIIGWLFVGALKGAYGPSYFTPVDLGGLYWHLVDLIWIFLFPLLYLIH